MSLFHIRSGLRRGFTFFAAILSMGLLASPIASAAPTSVSICTQVLDNADTNTTEGGNFNFTASNQSVSFQTATLARDESQSASPPTCQGPFPLPVGSTELQVLQSGTLPANWLRNAPGYPKWNISDGAVTQTGSGQTADATGANFTTLTGAVTVTFTNASGRVINSICKQLLDNGVAPVETLNFTYSIAGQLDNLTATEGGAIVCDNTFHLDIPIGTTSLPMGEQSPEIFATGFPTVQLTGSVSGSQQFPARGSLSAGAFFTGPISIVGVAGDVKLTFTNKIATNRTVDVCEQLIDNADGINQSGVYGLQGGSGANLTAIGLTLTEGAAAPTCRGSFNESLSATTTLVRQTSMPGNFAGFAPGFPQWAIYSASNLATPLLSGTGNIADVPWNNPALANVTDVQVRITLEAGSFGNGSQANTGALIRICKLVEDNGDATIDKGVFTLGGSLTAAFFQAANSTLTLAENDPLDCVVSVARWSANDTAAISEGYGRAFWTSDAAGYPRLRTYDIATPTAASVFLTDTQMTYGEGPFNGVYSAGAAYSSAPNFSTAGDFTAVVFNKSGGSNGRTIQFCIRVDDNGLAPNNDGGAWTGDLGSLTATEGSGPTCAAPIAMPDPNGPSWATQLGETFVPPTSWPGFDVYAGGIPVPASPYVAYSTTGGQSGVVDATANYSQFGPQMRYSQPQSFYQGLTGNITITFVARPSGRFQVCSQVLQNGDAINDSNTFGLSDTQGSAVVTLPSVTGAEGGTQVCDPIMVLPDAGALHYTETTPGSWNTSNNSPGFPQWQVSSTGISPTTLSGSSLTTSTVPQAPAAQQGDVTAVFLNRLGPSRFVTFCKEMIDNGDATNDSGTFQLATRTDDSGTPSLGNYSLTVSESGGRVCGPPIQVPVTATTLGATETLPVGFISAANFPAWKVETSAGATALSGSGSDTGNLNLNAINTSDFSVVLQNQKATGADVQVTKTGPASAQIGQNVAYTLTVKNNGPTAATGVMLADPTPSGLTFVSATAPCATGFPCTIGAMAIGATTTVTATFAIPATYASTTVTNTATVTATTADPNANNNRSTVITPVGGADVAISKTGPATALPGQNITYTLAVTDNGPNDATGVVVFDPTPGGLTFVSATAPCTGGVNVGCNLGTITKGATTTFTVTYAIPSSYSVGGIINTASVQSFSPDPTTTNNQSNVSTRVLATDVAITKTGPASVQLGQNVAYTVTVTNSGPADATAVQLADPTPAGLTFVSATPPCTTGFPCTLGTLASGATTPITVTYAVPANYNAATIVNTATVSTTTAETNPNNNTAVVTTPVIGTDLTITKIGPATAQPGQTLDYTLTITNQGQNDAAAVQIADPTPSGLTFVSATAPCTLGFPCNLGTLAKGATATITVTYSIPGGYAGTSIVNTASVSSTTFDPATANNTSSVTTPVSGADVAITKSGPASVQPGQNAVYTIAVHNNGPNDATGVQVVDATPSGLTFVSATAPCASGFPCTLGTLTNGATTTITVTYSVPASYSSATIVNTASLSSTTLDPVATNNTSTVTTATQVSSITADLSVTKSGPASVLLGNDMTYTISVHNAGPDDAAGVKVDDPTPSGLTFVSATAPCAGGFPCTLGTLANGATTTITVTYTVPSGYASNSITNTATVATTTSDPTLSNNTSTAQTSVSGPGTGTVDPVPMLDWRGLLALLGLVTLVALNAKRLR